MGRTPSFARIVAETDESARYARDVEILMLNVGLRCTMACSHCHVDAGPGRSDSMDDETMEHSIRLARELGVELVDITGGAPELHPRLLELVDRLEVPRVRVRTNILALTSDPELSLARELAERDVELLASMPGPGVGVVDEQRGEGAHDAIIEGLHALNGLGFGTSHRLDIAHNPNGTSLPESSTVVERRYRTVLGREGIAFTGVAVLTNVPVGRFRDALVSGDQLADYLDTLREAFNPRTLRELECRRSVEIDWDGTLWDCDFNLGAGLPAFGRRRNVRETHASDLVGRTISVADHCFACTAAAGSG